MFLIQDLELLDTITIESEDIYFVFDLKEESLSSFADIQAHMHTSELGVFIANWVLGILVKMGVSRAKNTKILNLSNLGLQSIPYEILNLPKLGTLVLEGNTDL
tara:strand:- start:173 stop:484 length:312 start_codon:yes stop_codon:yes gene_type:complete